MSWVSILEDSIKRLDSDLHMLASDLPPSAEVVSLHQWKMAVGLIARGQMILSDAAKYLDLATDPSVELAVALQSSENEAGQLKAKLSEFQRTCLSLASHLSTAEGELRELRRKVKAMRTQNNQLTVKLDELARSNPAATYAAFSKGHQRK